jgi:hypothetical protein
MNVTLTPIGGANRLTQLARAAEMGNQNWRRLLSVTITWRAKWLKDTTAASRTPVTASSPASTDPVAPYVRADIFGRSQTDWEAV